MPKINQLVIAGNLTRDPELTTVGNGTQLCKFGIAHNEVFTSNGEKQEKTTYLDIVAWGKTAEIAAEGLKVGYPILLQGKIGQSSWEDKETGQQRTRTEITASYIECLRWANTEGQNGGGNQGKPARGGNPGAGRQQVNEPIPEDDIPF